MAVENPRDIGVAQIISPVSAEGLGQESITVRIKNYADIPVDGFDVCYTVNGGEPVTEHVGESLLGRRSRSGSHDQCPRRPRQYLKRHFHGVGVKLSVDGKEVASQEVTVNILSKKDVTVENALAGLGDGRHIMKAEVSHPSDNNFDNNTVEKEFFVVEQAPALIYDFEDGQFPDDLTWRIEDTYAIASGAIYTAGGVKVMDITTPTADISSLGHGLYIINIDGRGIKLAL